MAGSYPQQFAGGVFYVPRPETQGNAFAALWHGWHQVRSPYAQAMFNARLAALDPTAQYKLLENLYERRAQMLEQAASIERASMQAQSNAQSGSDRRYAAWVAAQASMTGAYYGYRAQRERGELDLQGEIMKAGHLEDTTRTYLEDYQRAADAAATRANQGPDGAGDAAAIMSDALDTAAMRIQSLQTTDPMQADALARAVRATQLPINDNELEQAFSQAIDASVPSAPNYSTTRPGQLGRPAELPFYDPAASVPPSGSGQAPPAATGRQPDTTAGGTTAPTRAAPPFGSTSQSVSVRTSGAPISPITAQLLAAADELSGDIADTRARIPDARAELGGFYDPIPGTPRRGDRRAAPSPMVADLLGPGPSMRAAAAPMARPTFAPLTPPAQAGTVAPQGEPAPAAGERAPQGPGVVASGGTARSAAPAGSPPSPPAPKTAPSTLTPPEVLAPARAVLDDPEQRAAMVAAGPTALRADVVDGLRPVARDLLGPPPSAAPPSGARAPAQPAGARPLGTPLEQARRVRGAAPASAFDPVAAARAPVADPAPAPASRWGDEFNRAWYSFQGSFPDFSAKWDQYQKAKAADPSLTWETFQGAR